MAETRSPEEIYGGLRSMALSVRPEPLGAEVGPDEPYVAVMEFTVGEYYATVVAVIDGSASLYFSNGGGNIGGGQHEGIRRAAREMIAESALAMEELHSVRQFPLPGPDMVTFYVVTPDGIYSAVDEEERLGHGQSPLSALFFAGHKVISEYRLLSKKGNG